MSVETRALVWRTLAAPLRARRGAFALVIVLSALSAGASLVEPLIYRSAIDDIAGLFVRRAYEKAGAPDYEGADTSKQHGGGHVAARTPSQALNTLLWAVVLLSATTAASRIFSLASNNVASAALSGIEENFIYRTFEHVLRLPLSFFGKRSTGTIGKRIDQSDQVGPLIGAFVEDLIPQTISLVGMLAVMLTQNVLLTAIALATVPPYLLLARLSTKRLEKTAGDYYEQWDQVSAQIQEKVGAIKTVKLSGAEEREVEQLKQTSARAYRAYLDRTRLENRFINWQGFLTQISEAAILGVGGWLVLQHKLTPGDVVMFVSYVSRVYDPIDDLASLATTVQEHLVSVARAARLLETGSEESAGAALAPGRGQVEFRDVRFGYVPEREVLTGLSFVLEPGTVTALVGPSGCGKTTTADLLLCLYQPSHGQILIDGHSIRECSAASVRAAIGVVAVDGAVFQGTLASNLRYKRPDATDEDVRAAALAAGLERTIERLPGGLDAEIGERGVGLSMGERQRLQIARVLVARPRILVLDEATANLDYATELEVKQAIDALRSDTTTLVIAHRYSMIRDADRVLVMEGGKIVEAGTPQELLRTGGWFSALARGAGQEQKAKASEPAEFALAVAGAADERAGPRPELDDAEETSDAAEGDEDEGDEGEGDEGEGKGEQEGEGAGGDDDQDEEPGSDDAEEEESGDEEADGTVE